MYMKEEEKYIVTQESTLIFEMFEGGTMIPKGWDQIMREVESGWSLWILFLK